MKKIPFLIVLTIMLFSGCRKERDTLTLSPSVFESVDGDGDILKSTITCNSSWMALASDHWLSPAKSIGNGDATLTITVLPNPNGQPRQGSITIVTDDMMDEIRVEQLPLGADSPQNAHYTIPVIF
ncbi:MAG: BACON domain-containing protein, partial [Rikenellaceae bacterium]|nr:BACON domain-containing protein [Rikenellaceae bacterium]